MDTDWADRRGSDEDQGAENLQIFEWWLVDL
jgi:hypothetical protein